MTKAFTALSILKLRDEGGLALDAPAENYLPELRGWKYPTDDSPRIRVRDLLNHTAGFVSDDPCGDRQTPLPEAEFTRLLQAGVPFTRPPATAFEYSNLGDAMFGRIVATVSRRPYKDYVERTLLRPLGMAASGSRSRRSGSSDAPSATAGKTTSGEKSRCKRTGPSAPWAGCRRAPRPDAEPQLLTPPLA